jgi:hypothetical protein
VFWKRGVEQYRHTGPIDAGVLRHLEGVHGR